MAHFKVTHSAFHDVHAKIDLTASSLIVNGEVRAADLLRRLTSCGATDARAVELTAEQYREIVMARLPQLAPAAR